MQSQTIPKDAEILAISEITNEFHKAGVLGKEAILKIKELSEDFDEINSLETGCGKSTLLFSNISRRHLCFTLGATDSHDDQSLAAVQQNAHFNSATVEFVLGPTQKTLPIYQFESPFQIIFIDGPHGFPFPDLEYYFLYPHLVEGGLLILDDIHIPTVCHLYEFLKEDDMFSHVGNVATTAFFRRTVSPLFDPTGDGWWLQQYNVKRFPDSARRFQPASFRSRVYNSLVKYCGVEFADKVRRALKR